MKNSVVFRIIPAIAITIAVFPANAQTAPDRQDPRDGSGYEVQQSTVSATQLRTFYGPARFVRTTGAPLKATVPISTKGYKAPFVLHVRNGELNGSNRVSAAEVLLSGKLMLGPSHFNQQASEFHLPVNLTDPATLEVWIASAPGSSLTIWLEGTPDFVVGPMGGRLEYPNGIILDVPPGAVSQDTLIEIFDLPATAQQIDLILASRSAVSHRKRFLGGFATKPSYLRFNAPVSVSLPVAGRSPAGLPLTAHLALARGTYWLTPTNLVYNPDQGRVIFETAQFGQPSGGGLFTLAERSVLADDPTANTGTIIIEGDESLDPNDPCTRGLIHVRSQSGEFSKDDCQLVADDVQVTFLSCGGKTFRVVIGEASEGCPKDTKVHARIDAPPYVAACSSAVLKTIIWATEGSSDKILINENEMFADWTSSNPTAADFEDKSSGVIYGKQLGVTTVSAKTVFVTASESLDIVAPEVKRLDIDPEQTPLCEGQITFKATAEYAPEAEACKQPITWNLSSTGAARLTPTGEGTAELEILMEKTSPAETVLVSAIIKSLNGSKSTTANVRVGGIESLEVTPASVTLKVGEARTLTVTVKDACGNLVQDPNLTWTTIPAGEIIAFDPGAKTVRGVSQGTATLQVEVAGLKKSIPVNVTADSCPVVSLSVSPSSVILLIGASQSLSATVKDACGNTHSNVSWTVPPGGIISFSPGSPATVTGQAEGTATLQVQAGGHNASVSVQVKDERVPDGANYKYSLEFTQDWGESHQCTGGNDSVFTVYSDESFGAIKISATVIYISAGWDSRYVTTSLGAGGWWSWDSSRKTTFTPLLCGGTDNYVGTITESKDVSSNITSLDAFWKDFGLFDGGNHMQIGFPHLVGYGTSGLSTEGYSYCGQLFTSGSQTRDWSPNLPLKWARLIPHVSEGVYVYTGRALVQSFGSETMCNLSGSRTEV